MNWRNAIWPSKPTPSDAGRQLQAKRLADEHMSCRERTNAIRALQGKPPIDFDKLRADARREARG